MHSRTRDLSRAVPLDRAQIQIKVRVSSVPRLPVRYRLTACARRHFALFGETVCGARSTLRRRDSETRRRIEAPYNCLTSSPVLTSSVALALPPAIASATPPSSSCSPRLGSPLPPPSVLQVLERTCSYYSTKPRPIRCLWSFIEQSTSFLNMNTESIIINDWRYDNDNEP